MSLLTEFRSSLENPQTPLSYPAEWLTDIYNGGRTDSGLRVSQMSALQLPVVFACVNIVASGVAGLPLNVHELGATASGRLTRKLAADHTLQDLLHDRPHPEMSSFTWRFVLMCHALLFGNAFAEVLYDNGGRIAAFAPRMPWKTGAVRITRDMRIADAFGDVRDVKAGTLLYKTTQGLEGEQDYTPTNPYIADPLNYNRRTERFIFPEDMLFVPGLTLDGRVGQDTIFLARQAIGLALAAEKFGAKFFGNGGHPGGLLSLIGNVDKQQMEKARETFQEATGGENMHRLLVVKGDWKYSPLSTPNDAAQFIQTRDHQVKEISSLFQVPMHMLGDSGGTNKATAEQLGMEFVNYTLGPWLPKFEQELKYKLFTLPNTRGRNSGRYEPKFDTTALMFPDAESRRNYYHNAKLDGWLSTNDIREKEGLNPIDGKDGGEDYWQPVNMTVVGAEPDADDANGNATPLPENKPDSGDSTRAEERAASVFVSHTVKAYLAPYSDAFNRILSRDKRGLEQVSKVFLPLLMGVRSAIAYPVYGGDVPDSLPETDKFLDSYISSMSKRADAWKAEDSKPELERAVKAIAISVLREQAAARVN